MDNQNNVIPQIDREGFLINESGILEFDQCSILDLAKKYGTPCYIFSENIIRKKFNRDFILSTWDKTCNKVFQNPLSSMKLQKF